MHRIHSDVINPMNEKGSRKEERNVSEGRDRRSRNGKNQRVCRGCEEAGDSRMIALGVQKKMKNKAEWTPSEHTSGGNYEVEEDDSEAEKYQEKRSRKMSEKEARTSTKAER